MNKEETQGKQVQELQILEQQKQIFLMEKQSVQVELNEINNALEELNKTGDEAYKILGGIMIKTEKNSLIKELSDKRKVIEIRINALEKQEKLIENKIGKTRADVVSSINAKR